MYKTTKVQSNVCLLRYPQFPHQHITKIRSSPFSNHGILSDKKVNIWKAWNPDYFQRKEYYRIGRSNSWPLGAWELEGKKISWEPNISPDFLRHLQAEVYKCRSSAMHPGTIIREGRDQAHERARKGSRTQIEKPFWFLGDFEYRLL